MNFGEGDAQMVEFSPALPNHGAFFLRTNQHGLVLKPIQRARQHGPALVPYDLLVMLKADSKQTG